MYVGVTVIVPANTLDVEFWVVKLIFPLPDGKSPIAGFEFVQLYTTPEVKFELKIKFTDSPWQNAWLLIEFILGIGLTVIVAIAGLPVHVWLSVVSKG